MIVARYLGYEYKSPICIETGSRVCPNRLAVRVTRRGTEATDVVTLI